MLLSMLLLMFMLALKYDGILGTFNSPTLQSKWRHRDASFLLKSSVTKAVVPPFLIQSVYEYPPK
jgi:hypothetical protein